MRDQGEPVDLGAWRDRRQGQETEPQHARVTINVATREIEVDGKKAVLSPGPDFRIFLFIAKSRVDVSAMQVADVRRLLESGEEATTTPTAYYINRIRSVIETDPHDPKILLQTGQKKGTKYRLNGQVEIIGEGDRWKYVPVSGDRLSTLEAIVMNINIQPEQIIAGLAPDKNGKALNASQAWIALRGANNVLNLRAGDRLLTREEKEVFDRLKAFWSFNNIDGADGFKSYIYRRIFGRELVIKGEPNKPEVNVLAQDGGAVEDHPQNVQVEEPGLRVSLPKVDRPRAVSRQDRLMAWYEQTLKLYNDFSWTRRSPGTWGEAVADAKVRQRAMRAIGRIEGQLATLLSYSEEELKSRKEQLREVTVLYEPDFSLPSMEFFQRRLREYRQLAAKERVKPSFEAMKQGRERIGLSVVVNDQKHEAIIGDKLVKFESEAQRRIFSYLVRRRGQEVLPKDIMAVAREAGVIVQKAFSIMGDLRQLVEDNPNAPKIILALGRTRAARYIFKAPQVEFFREKQVIPASGQEQVVLPAVERPRREAAPARTRLRIEVKDPNIHERIKELAQEVIDANLPTRVTISQLTRAFSALVIKRRQQAEARGIITPVQGFDQHPIFSRREIVILLYDLEAVRKGQSLSKKEARELGPMIDAAFADLERANSGFK